MEEEAARLGLDDPIHGAMEAADHPALGQRQRSELRGRALSQIKGPVIPDVVRVSSLDCLEVRVG